MNGRSPVGMYSAGAASAGVRKWVRRDQSKGDGPVSAPCGPHATDLRPASARFEAYGVAGGLGAQQPRLRGGGVAVRAHLTAPRLSPATKWRWKRRKTMTVGAAAMTEPAAMTFHWDTYWP